MKQRTKKAFVWLMTLAMLLSLLPAAGLTVLAAEGDVTYKYPVYVDAADPSKGINSEWETGTKAASEYTVVTSSTTQWTTGWYVVNSGVSISSSVTVSGNVNLILADGASLTISEVAKHSAGICVSEDGNSLTIYGQSAGSGKLEVTGGTYAAGTTSPSTAAKSRPQAVMKDPASAAASSEAAARSPSTAAKLQLMAVAMEPASEMVLLVPPPPVPSKSPPP